MFRMWSLLRSYGQLNYYKGGVKRTLHLSSPYLWHRSSNLYSSSVSDNTEKESIFDVAELANGDETLKRKLQILLLEVDVWRQEGQRIPPTLNPNEWKELTVLESKKARLKYLEFCWKKYMRKQNLILKKEEERLIREKAFEERANIPDDPNEYRLGKNTMFMRFSDTAITHLFNTKLIQAMLFGQEIVVDCGYNEYMTTREHINCGKQLMLLFSKNRSHDQPFNLYFCNTDRESRTMQDFVKIVNTAYEPHFPLNITEKSYLDLFPKERLVYLTPHCREELVNFDHDAVYIIGGIVDKKNNQHLSLAKAKEQGLKMAKFPLDRYLSFSSGSGKNLTLDQVIMIMLDMRQSGNWEVALQHVPSRKLQKSYQVDYTVDKFKLISDKFNRTSYMSVSKKVQTFR